MIRPPDPAPRAYGPGRPGATPLTPRQEEALASIQAHFRTHGVPPTIRELAAALGSSSTSVPWHLCQVLASKGYLTIEGVRGHHRQIRLTWRAVPPVHPSVEWAI
jgi:SOS-response transcriptional repressor LexA